jgi:hypothetical protein
MQSNDFLVNYQVNTLDYLSRIEVSCNLVVTEKRILEFNGTSSGASLKQAGFWAASEAAKVAEQTYQKFANSGTPLVLCISGGLDSQAMLYAFLQAKVPFEVAVMRFNDRLNEHDIGHALSLLSTLGIKPNVIDLNIKKFFESGEFTTFAESGCTGSPQFAAHIWLAHQIQGVPVFAGEPWHTAINQTKDKQRYYVPQYKEYGTEISLARKGRTALSHFFELSGAWLQSILAEAQFRFHYRDEADPPGSYQAKFKFYRSLGFPVSMPAGLVKLTGFERLYALIATENQTNHFYHFNKLYRVPLEKKFPPSGERLFQVKGFNGEFWDALPSISE